MLDDASQSTAIAGFSSGRNSSIHSGWLNSTAIVATSKSRKSSSEPTLARKPARRQAMKQKPAVISTTTTDVAIDQGVPRNVSERDTFMTRSSPAARPLADRVRPRPTSPPALPAGRPARFH